MTTASECQDRSLPNEKGQTSSRRRRVLAHQSMESSAPGSTGGQGRPHPPPCCRHSTVLPQDRAKSRL